MLTQLAYLATIKQYIADGGKSRGSYLIAADGADGADGAVEIDTENSSRAIVTNMGRDRAVSCRWEDVRPIPKEDNWFENVWRNYRTGDVFK